jgi:hypothetical protein
MTTPPDVPLKVFEAAIRLKATHLSTDGKRAYFKFIGGIFVSEWGQRPGSSAFEFGPWKRADVLPPDAVEIP